MIMARAQEVIDTHGRTFDTGGERGKCGTTGTLIVKRLGACVRTVALAAMVLWLAGKDWLTSNASPYPYADAIAVSAAVVFAAIGAAIVCRCRVWRDVIVLCGTVALGLCW